MKRMHRNYTGHLRQSPPARSACPACGKKSLVKVNPEEVQMASVYAVMHVCRSCGEVTGLRRDSLGIDR